MTQVSDESAGIQVTVRYFAAARAAAGARSEKVTLRSGATVAELIDGLSVRDVRLATVLSRCSYLRDGIVVEMTPSRYPPATRLTYYPLSPAAKAM